MIDYSPHFDRIRSAQAVMKGAERALNEVQYDMRKSAVAEATESLASAGVEIEKTLLMRDAGRSSWRVQKREPILIRFLTCWSAPGIDTPNFPKWQLQMHYAFARKDGQPNKARNEDYSNIVVDHPSGFAAAVLERFPLWA
jgi:hypothetical protein